MPSAGNLRNVEQACELCGNALTGAGNVPGYQEPAVYSILDCRSCYTMVAEPRKLDARVYEAIYAVPGGAPGYDRYYHYARQIRYARNPLRYLTTRVDAAWGVVQALRTRKARTILEVGCGLGYFTYALKMAGYDAQGLDVSHEAIEQARQAYGDFFRAEPIESYADAAAPRRFDAIVMVEVIEHLEDPLATMAHAVRLLAPGGSLILTTPNRQYYGYDKAWSTDLPPLHLWWFSEKSIDMLAKRIGCTAEFVDFGAYNRRYPVLHTFTCAHAAQLDAQGRVLRRESWPMRVARSAGLLHDAYWMASRAAGMFKRGAPETRRPTMVAILRRAGEPGSTAAYS